jgi:hypothetical protein
MLDGINAQVTPDYFSGQSGYLPVPRNNSAKMLQYTTDQSPSTYHSEELFGEAEIAGFAIGK